MMQLKILERQEQPCWWQEIMKTRAELKKTETKKPTQRIDESKS